MSDDPVRIQINVKIKTPRGKKPPKRVVQEAVERWAATGEESKFVQIRAVHWLNPERKHAELAMWKVATAYDVGPDEFLKLMIPGEKRTSDTIEQARRSLRLEYMPAGAFSAMLFIKEAVAIEKPEKAERKSGKRKGRGAKDVKKRARKVSSVRRAKRKNKGK